MTTFVRRKTGNYLDADHKAAQDFLDQAFSAAPNSIKEDIIPFTNRELLDGGKSGARVYRGIYKKTKAILKIYRERDFLGEVGTKKKWKSVKFKKDKRDPIVEAVFTAKGTKEQKRDDYIRAIRGDSKEYIGDGELHYIRSIRDIYINIILRHKKTKDNEPISATLLDYGFIKIDNSFQPFMITGDLKADRFIELENYKPKPKSILPLKILLQLLKVLEIKYKSFQNAKNDNIGCHRDLHPGNVFYKITNKHVKIKLIDFDLSITDQEILNRLTNCDRKTMQDKGSIKGKILGNLNKTTGLYTGVVRGSTFRLYRSDADLFQIMSYWIYYVKHVEPNIKKKINDLKKMFETSEVFRGESSLAKQKERFFTAMISGLDAILKEYVKEKRKKNAQRILKF
jgi:serine/threonine protein kinase